MHLLKPLHLAVETSGYTRSEIFRKLVANVDLVLMDIKQTDPEIHKKYTGVDNKQILKNLDYLCKANTPFHIRIPLIPGVNDTLNNMEKTAVLIKDAKNLVSVDFLAYHLTAPSKYYMLNKQFNPDFDTNKQVKIHAEAFEKYNIKTNVL